MTSVRVAREVSRASTPRAEYERESRRIRFDAYRQAMAEFGAAAVFFGHHEGDVHENVVSNIFKAGRPIERAASPFRPIRIPHSRGLSSMG